MTERHVAPATPSETVIASSGILGVCDRALADAIDLVGAAPDEASVATLRRLVAARAAIAAATRAEAVLPDDPALPGAGWPNDHRREAVFTPEVVSGALAAVALCAYRCAKAEMEGSNAGSSQADGCGSHDGYGRDHRPPGRPATVDVLHGIFGELAKLLDVDTRSDTPERLWREKMRPRLTTVLRGLD